MKRTIKRGKGSPADTPERRPEAPAHPLLEPTVEKRRELPWEEPDLDSDEDEAAEEAEEAAPAAEEHDDHAPDDALGLYLRQMGAIPLLNRDQEIALAQRLEEQRDRYRHAAMCNWRTLA